MGKSESETEGARLFPFAGFGLRAELVEALQQLGYEEPTPVQRAAIPALLAGKDVLGQAATGTGKTAAFALPLLSRLQGKTAPHEARMLVVVPTRELAMQVAEAMHRYGRNLGTTVLPVYGGQDIGQQLRRLKHGVDVVVATPGRALDHVRRGTLRLKRVQSVVLDEADEMLDLGFAEELAELFEALPEERQTALFSATLPPKITALAERHLRKPARIRIDPERAAEGALPLVRQVAYVVPKAFKELALARILDVEAPTSAILFCRTRLEVERVAELLGAHGYEVAALHGGMSQEQRDRAIKRLKGKRLQLLVATDVAARGIDVERLSHVINFDLPSAPEAYVHRIGRTGRAGQAGVAVTLLEPREHRLLRSIERVTGQPITLAQPPSAQDLKARQRDALRMQLLQRLQEPQTDDFEGLVEQLSTAGTPSRVAAAAMSLLSELLVPPSASDQTEIPAFRPADEKRPAQRHKGPPAQKTKGGRRVFFSVGRLAGVRPGDLVGALINEAGLTAQEVGVVNVFDRHSLVEVAEHRVEQVLQSLQNTTLRGRKFRVELDRGR